MSHERHTEPIQIYFQSSQKAALESWLRRERPGLKVGTFIREAAMAAVDANAAPESALRIHLEEPEREALMKSARELGHRDLTIWIEEFLIRVAARPVSEVVSFFLGESAPPAPAGTAAPTSAPTSTASHIGNQVLSILEEMRAQGRVRFEGDPPFSRHEEDEQDGDQRMTA